MKDVAEWFAPEDFLALMKDKQDKTIQLIDVTVYYDGDRIETFIDKSWVGEFVDRPRGLSGASLNKVIRRIGSTRTIAENWDLRDRGLVADEEKIFKGWERIAMWLKENQ